MPLCAIVCLCRKFYKRDPLTVAVTGWDSLLCRCVSMRRIASAIFVVFGIIYVLKTDHRITYLSDFIYVFMPIPFNRMITFPLTNRKSRKASLLYPISIVTITSKSTFPIPIPIPIVRKPTVHGFCWILHFVWALAWTPINTCGHGNARIDRSRSNLWLSSYCRFLRQDLELHCPPSSRHVFCHHWCHVWMATKDRGTVLDVETKALGQDWTIWGGTVLVEWCLMWRHR